MLLVAVIGTVDYLTGWEVSFAIFYFLPVSLATWYFSRQVGLLFSVGCAAIWFAADAATHPAYSHPSIPVWNALVRFGFFAVATLHVSLLRRSVEHERDLARTDPLTGAANTRAFFEVAGHELSRCRRYGRPLSLAYVDIDDFKLVNDAGGHLRGDALLVLLSGILKSHTRETDLVARLGGDEFAILFPETGYDDARSAVRNLRLAIDDGCGDGESPFTVSVGVLTCEVMPPGVDDLVRKADALMYRVKTTGKDGVRHETVGRPSPPQRSVAAGSSG